MKDAGQKVIYVGKSKALRNRVSQYFQSGHGHNEKTKRMVASVYDFEYILTDSEIEALALENKLIKLYTPRYNIRLKDGKSYPYIRLEREKGRFPHVSVTRTRKKDKALYFGPYSGVKTAYDILEVLKRVFLLPSCKYRFPESTGKVRPCLYMQMNQCLAPCAQEKNPAEWEALGEELTSFLRGNIGETRRFLKRSMQDYSEQLCFEEAALCRDRLKALDRLSDKQKVVGEPGESFDVVSVYEDEKSACIGILYVRDGALSDSEYMPLEDDVILDGEAVSAALCNLYSVREYLPETVYTDYPLEEEALLQVKGYLSSIGKETVFRLCSRGAKKQLCLLAKENAGEAAAKKRETVGKNVRSLMRLATLIGMEVYPESIEAVDISNFGNEEITAGFVRFEAGEPRKKGYRLYKMREVRKQDDYASMEEALRRRLAHREDTPLPDLLLVDGGKGQTNIAKEVLWQEGVSLPVLGMVKDDFHKTRALTDGENELSIAGEQAVYMLIYKIQEEVHRFVFGAATRGKRKKMRKSSLEEIPGIGAKKAKALLQFPGGLAALRVAEPGELEWISGINKKDAQAVYRYFHPSEVEKNRQIEEKKGTEK